LHAKLFPKPREQSTVGAFDLLLRSLAPAGACLLALIALQGMDMQDQNGRPNLMVGSVAFQSTVASNFSFSAWQNKGFALSQGDFNVERNVLVPHTFESTNRNQTRSSMGSLQTLGTNRYR
jgi:hypothetical protein